MMKYPLVRPTSDGVRIREAPVDGKPIGQIYVNDTIISLESAEQTRQKVGKTGAWLKIRTPDGTEAYTAAWLLEIVSLPPAPEPQAAPADPLSPDDAAPVYVRARIDGLRIRETPVDGVPVGQVGTLHALMSLEPAEQTRAKIGQVGQWINIRAFDGTSAYIAAWFVEETPAPPRPRGLARKVNILGMNLDNFHPQGTPDPSRLGGLGWVRFGYNVSAGTGSQDIQRAYNTYARLAERYARAGYRVMFALTHQTYGEGRNEYWPWHTMTNDKWRHLTARFSEMVGRIAAQYAGSDLVHCWQIWNEQDAPTGAAASVPMSPRHYALLLAEAISAVRSADSEVVVISGGHTRGPQEGSRYARATINAMPAGVLPDGIAFHPYGRGTRPGTRYANWGHIEEELAAYVSILPDRPVWITEWGALDKEGDNPADLAQYAQEFIDYINQRYPGRVAAAIWYAWAMGMHNGYGLVGRDDRPLNPLYQRFLALRG